MFTILIYMLSTWKTLIVTVPAWCDPCEICSFIIFITYQALKNRLSQTNISRDSTAIVHT